MKLENIVNALKKYDPDYGKIISFFDNRSLDNTVIAVTYGKTDLSDEELYTVYIMAGEDEDLEIEHFFRMTSNQANVFFTSE
ncbi:MAG: hypothetical protein ACFFD4_04985 [Candidatus Odinarchaeota archaeon]